jgi:Caspase domain
MDRGALLIGGPGYLGDQHYLVGVERDLETYRSFLLSPLGGAWASDEIRVFKNSAKSDVVSATKSLQSVNYSLVLFFGYGRYDESYDDTVVDLGNGDELSCNDLKVGAPKHTLIVDCCRSRAIIALDEALAKAEREAPRLNAADCRIYYDAHIGKCPTGNVTLFACSINESADESSERGGFYSWGLVSAATRWLTRSSIDTSKQYDILTITAAHEEAAVAVRRRTADRQNPVIEKPRSGLYFPFAVIA